MNKKMGVQNRMRYERGRKKENKGVEKERNLQVGCEKGRGIEKQKGSYE